MLHMQTKNNPLVLGGAGRLNGEGAPQDAWICQGIHVDVLSLFTFSAVDISACHTRIQV